MHATCRQVRQFRIKQSKLASDQRQRTNLREAVPTKPITEEAPDSAVSERSNHGGDRGTGQDRVWNSTAGGNDSAGSKSRQRVTEAQLTASRAARSRLALKQAARSQARSKWNDSQGFIAPQLAQQALCSSQTARTGCTSSSWMAIESKFRYGPAGTPAPRRPARLGLLTRKGLDWTSLACRTLRLAAAQLNVKDAILDGEAVALDDHGVSNFADLQAAFQEERSATTSRTSRSIFSTLDGHNLRGLPLSETKTDC
jgi:bifunctional non-homologous end joining protein LigD